MTPSDWIPAPNFLRTCADGCPISILRPAAVVAKSLALFAQMLRVFLRLIGNVESVGFVQRSLFVRVHVDVTLDAHLSHVSPTVPAHPLSFARRALVLAEATLLSLVRRKTFALWSCLWKQEQCFKAFFHVVQWLHLMVIRLPGY